MVICQICVYVVSIFGELLVVVFCSVVPRDDLFISLFNSFFFFLFTVDFLYIFSSWLLLFYLSQALNITSSMRDSVNTCMLKAAGIKADDVTEILFKTAVSDDFIGFNP